MQQFGREVDDGGFGGGWGEGSEGGGGERKRIAPVEKLYRRIGAEPRPFGLTAPDAEASAMACSPEG